VSGRERGVAAEERIHSPSAFDKPSQGADFQLLPAAAEGRNSPEISTLPHSFYTKMGHRAVSTA
jgi:hypothetical protein